jgi:putative phosphoesterase
VGARLAREFGCNAASYTRFRLNSALRAPNVQEAGSREQQMRDELSTQVTVRVAIVSDTHGQICPDVEAVVARCDVAVHAGDIGSSKVLDRLRSSAGRVVAVRGNNDVPGLWAGDELEVLDTVPRVAELQLPGGKLLVEHGHIHGPTSPDLGKLRAAPPGARAIVYGHTHRQLVDRTADPWVLNPGAAGRIRNHGGPSCLVLHAREDSWDVEVFKFPGE